MPKPGKITAPPAVGNAGSSTLTALLLTVALVQPEPAWAGQLGERGFHGGSSHGGGFHNPGLHNPAFHNPAFHNPAFHNPGFHNPAFHNPVFHNPAFHNPAFHNPALHNPGLRNPAFLNPAFRNPSHGSLPGRPHFGFDGGAFHHHFAFRRNTLMAPIFGGLSAGVGLGGPDYSFPDESYYAQYWYCANPPGYYPSVTQCNTDWQMVPAN